MFNSNALAYDSSQGVFYEKGKKMDIFGKYKSPLGYTLGTNNIDSYGVDHSGFTTRDEIAYQTARQQRENQIMQNYNGQSITQDYPQYGTDFWGSSPENNYGFGASNITPNVENMQNTPVPNIGPKPLSQEQMYTPPSHAAEVLTAGIQGFGQGTVTGMESFANGATFGGYNWLDDKLDLGAAKRCEDLKQYANAADVGTAFDIANKVTEFAGGGLSGYGAVAKGIPATRQAYNAYNIYKGGRNLENQLQRGNNFEDIYMGRIDRDKLNEINNIRQELGESVINSERVIIPKDRVEHIYNRRIIQNGYSPKNAASTISDALFNKKSNVSPSRYSTLQKMESPSANRVVVGKIRNGNDIFVKTGYRK